MLTRKEYKQIAIAIGGMTSEHDNDYYVNAAHILNLLAHFTQGLNDPNIETDLVDRQNNTGALMDRFDSEDS